MVRNSFVYLIVALIAIVSNGIDYLALQLQIGAIPGWHTSFFPTFYSLLLLLTAWIALLPILYYVQERNGLVLNKRIVRVHLYLTLIYFILLEEYKSNLVDYVGDGLMWLLLLTFVLGQCLFIGAWVLRKT